VRELYFAVNSPRGYLRLSGNVKDWDTPDSTIWGKNNLKLPSLFPLFKSARLFPSPSRRFTILLAFNSMPNLATSQLGSDEIVRAAIVNHHGLPLLPQPSGDERDPLRWPRKLKLAALTATTFFNFTANFAGSGLSVATPMLQAQFQKSANQVNAVLTVSIPSRAYFLWACRNAYASNSTTFFYLVLATFSGCHLVSSTGNEPLYSSRC
jgi:hypothetical protein